MSQRYQELSGPAPRATPDSLKHRLPEVMAFCQHLKLHKQKTRIEEKEGIGRRGRDINEDTIKVLVYS